MSVTPSATVVGRVCHSGGRPNPMPSRIGKHHPRPRPVPRGLLACAAELLVSSLLLAVLPQLPLSSGRCSPGTLAGLLELLDGIKHSPGQTVLRVLSQAAKERMHGYVIA